MKNLGFQQCAWSQSEIETPIMHLIYFFILKIKVQANSLSNFLRISSCKYNMFKNSKSKKHQNIPNKNY